MSRDLKEVLDLRNDQTCMREAVLLHYCVSGLWWATEAGLTPPQTSFIMAVLQMLLDNIRGEDDSENKLIRSMDEHTSAQAYSTDMLQSQSETKVAAVVELDFKSRHTLPSMIVSYYSMKFKQNVRERGI